VGRERELRELEAGLEDALSGRGRLFLIGGEPGIGKSRLADELATLAKERGARVLWGRCWEAGGAPAYWPWVQSIRSYMRNCDPDTLVAQLGGGASDLAQVFPELREIITGLSAPPSLDPEGARFRLFDSTSRFLINASKVQPLVFVLDDLHAADAPSLVLLRFLAGELADAHILIVGAYRDEELERDHALTETLAELGREQVTRNIRLLGLSQPDVAQFIDATAGIAPPESLVVAVHNETEGNPLFVVEVIGFLASEGQLRASVGSPPTRVAIPPRIREVIGRRLNRLSEDCTRILTLASVIGREFDLLALERASELSRLELLEALEEPVTARVVTQVPGALGRLRFSHALVRDVLYDGLTSLRRVQLHRQIGEMLEALYEGNAEPHLAELAHHFIEGVPGGDVDKAVSYTWRAGDRAMSLLAYEEAVRLYLLALQALELRGSVDDDNRCELLLALGDAQTRVGDAAAAKQPFLRAADIARKQKMPERLARAALGYGGRFVWARSGGDPNLVLLLEDALAAVGEEDSPLRVKLLARLAGANRDRPSREPRASLSQRAVEMARRIGDPATLAYALDGRYAAVWWPDNAEERLTIANEIIRLSDEVGDKERAAQGHDYRICALMELGDIATVDAELEVVTRLAEELRQPAQRWIATHTHAMRALFDGRFEDAEELIHEALEVGRGAQGWDAGVTFALQTFVLYREQGRLQEIEATIRRAVDEYSTRPMFRCVLANLYMELGRKLEAQRMFEDLSIDDFAGLPMNSNDWLFGMTFLPEVAAFLADVRRAAALYALLLPYTRYASSQSVEVSTGSASRYVGILATTMSRFDEAELHFDEALAMNSRMGAKPWVAHTQYDYAGMLLARDGPGDREKAFPLLTDAFAICKVVGMVALQGKVSRLLERRERSVELPEGGAAEPSPELDVGSSVFRREGEYWSMAYEGDVFRLKDSKGLRYIACLLRDPGREFHVIDLVSASEGVQPDMPSRRMPGRRHAEPGLHVPGEDAGSLLDPQAKVAYRRRLAELEGVLEEAEVWGDPERAALAKEELDFLTRELAGAMGLGGRDRKAASDAEHARINVTKAIRSALTRIGKNSPALGLHLDRTIRTGAFCSYIPDPRSAAPWQL
jgi:tetratricopeptide (TPR) repeat protein